MWNGLKYGFGFAIGVNLGLATINTLSTYAVKKIDEILGRAKEQENEE